MSTPADTPKPPYYAVIFTSVMREDARPGYQETAARMEELAKDQPGYLGIESAREGIGITVSYWRDLESIKRWKAVQDHAAAQARGRNDWYAQYQVRIAKVERDYGSTD